MILNTEALKWNLTFLSSCLKQCFHSFFFFRENDHWKMPLKRWNNA